MLSSRPMMVSFGSPMTVRDWTSLRSRSREYTRTWRLRAPSHASSTTSGRASLSLLGVTSANSGLPDMLWIAGDDALGSEGVPDRRAAVFCRAAGPAQLVLRDVEARRHSQHDVASGEQVWPSSKESGGAALGQWGGLPRSPSRSDARVRDGRRSVRVTLAPAAAAARGALTRLALAARKHPALSTTRAKPAW